MQRTARIVDTYISLELDLLSFLAEKCKADLSCKSWDGSNLLVRHVILEKKDKVVIGEEAIKSKQEVLWFQGPFSFWNSSTNTARYHVKDFKTTHKEFSLIWAAY